MKDSVGLIGKGVEINGDLRVEGALRIEGKVKGTIHTDGGTIFIGESGHVIANIASEICRVEGILEGDIHASNRVEITKSGRVKGEVITQNIVIAEGAIFEGQLKMLEDEVITHLMDKNQKRAMNKSPEVAA